MADAWQSFSEGAATSCQRATPAVQAGTGRPGAASNGASSASLAAGKPWMMTSHARKLDFKGQCCGSGASRLPGPLPLQAADLRQRRAPSEAAGAGGECAGAAGGRAGAGGGRLQRSLADQVGRDEGSQGAPQGHEGVGQGDRLGNQRELLE